MPYTALRRLVRQGQTSLEIARHFNVSRELVEYRLKVSRLWGDYRQRHEAEVAARYARRERERAARANFNPNGHSRHAG